MSNIDVEIATEVFGLLPCDDPIGRCDAVKLGQCYGLRDAKGVVAGNGLDGYSTNIQDAWCVVEAMRDKGWDFLINCGHAKDLPGTNKPWHVNFSPASGEELRSCEYDQHAYGETAPLAICKAALMAMRADYQKSKALT